MRLAWTVTLLILSSTFLVACQAKAQDAAPRVGSRTSGVCPVGWSRTDFQNGWNRGFRAEGQDRAFWLILPPKSFQGPRPVFLALNGTTEDGRGFAKRARLDDFAKQGFIVIAPSSAGNGTVWPVWDAMRQPGDHKRPNKDIAFFDALLSCVRGHFNVDSKRIFAGGHSAGGIMTHALLQRRSDVFAGGIIGSGVHSLTAPPKASPLRDMFVLVTWGGERDIWRGSTRSGVATNGMNFDNQAALIASYYAKHPKVSTLQCSKNIGHAWLDEANSWMIKQLLEHPKGTRVQTSSLRMPAQQTGVTCTDKPPKSDTLDVECKAPSKDAALCASACQMIADCGVENRAISSAMSDQLRAFGFSGSDMSQCSSCVERCSKTSKTSEDQAVLTCIDRARKATTCTDGFEGAYPWIQTVNTCCAAHPKSNLCLQMCSIVAKPRSATRRFFPSCTQ